MPTSSKAVVRQVVPGGKEDISGGGPLVFAAASATGPMQLIIVSKDYRALADFHNLKPIGFCFDLFFNWLDALGLNMKIKEK